MQKLRATYGQSLMPGVICPCKLQFNIVLMKWKHDIGGVYLLVTLCTWLQSVSFQNVFWAEIDAEVDK